MSIRKVLGSLITGRMILLLFCAMLGVVGVLIGGVWLVVDTSLRGYETTLSAQSERMTGIDTSVVALGQRIDANSEMQQERFDAIQAQNAEILVKLGGLEAGLTARMDGLANLIEKTGFYPDSSVSPNELRWLGFAVSMGPSVYDEGLDSGSGAVGVSVSSGVGMGIGPSTGESKVADYPLMTSGIVYGVNSVMAGDEVAYGYIMRLLEPVGEGDQEVVGVLPEALDGFGYKSRARLVVSGELSVDSNGQVRTVSDQPVPPGVAKLAYELHKSGKLESGSHLPSDLGFVMFRSSPDNRYRFFVVEDLNGKEPKEGWWDKSEMASFGHLNLDGESISSICNGSDYRVLAVNSAGGFESNCNTTQPFVFQ